MCLPSGANGRSLSPPPDVAYPEISNWLCISVPPGSDLDCVRWTLQDVEMPKGADMHLVMDNPATLGTRRIKDWFASGSHWHVHFAPALVS